MQPPLVTQVLVGLVQDRADAAQAVGSTRAGVAGEQEEALARRLQRLGSQSSYTDDSRTSLGTSETITN